MDSLGKRTKYNHHNATRDEKPQDIHKERERKRQEILDTAAIACEKLGGFASIDDQFAVVDLNKYKVVERKTGQCIG